MSKTFKTWHKIGKTLQLPYANEKKNLVYALVSDHLP